MRPRKKQNELPRCIYKKHGAYYYVKGGKWERLGKTLHEALQAYANKLAPHSDLFHILLTKATPYLLEGRAKNTVKSYTQSINHLKKIFVEFRIQQIQHGHIVRMMDALKETPVKANNHLNILRLFFSWALDREYITADPSIRVKRLKVKARDRLITHEEYALLILYSPEWLKHIIYACYFTGQRIGDILTLTRDNITDDGIFFRQQKTGKRLIVAWSPELKEVVEKALNRSQSQYLFSNTKGQQTKYQQVSTHFKNAAYKAKIKDVHIHDLRAFSGTEADRQGLNTTALLGHSDINTTKTYLRDKSTKIVQGPSGKLL